MLRSIKKLLFTLIVVLCLVSTYDAVIANNNLNYVSATSKSTKRNAKAKKAFKKYLSKKNISWPTSNSKYKGKDYSFKYMEIGKRKTPILIITCKGTYHMEHYVSVMQYSKNKVKCVLQFDGIENICKVRYNCWCRLSSWNYNDILL